MPYKLHEFITQAIPAFVERGSQQSIGTGRADTDLVRMPGGEWYDNQGDDISPRALDPITKSGVIYAVSGSTVRQQVDALRALLGAKGRLDVLWADDTVRWTWARFTSIRTTRGFAHTLTSLPVDLQYSPVGGYWYADEITTETESFTGVTTEADFTVTNAGNVNVEDMIITYVTPVAGLIVITLENYETAQHITMEQTGLGIGDSVVINVGERTAKIHDVPINIDSISRSGATITVEAVGHPFSAGQEAIVEGTDYDGVYVVSAAPGADIVELAADPDLLQPHGPQLSTGTILRTTGAYSPDNFSDGAKWFTLVPGANQIHVTTSDDLDGGSITFEFYARFG